MTFATSKLTETLDEYSGGKQIHYGKFMRVISLIGARPQFIKEAVLHGALKEAGIEEIIVNSAQHYDHNMAQVFFDDLAIKAPDYNLNVGSGSHAEMTARIMTEFERVVIKERPDAVLVYGDTNTTLAGALVAAKLKIPVAHVEAGVRMYPKDMPEEINRVLTDRVSRLLFCVSRRCVENLQKEGISEGVYFCGDVMCDLYLKQAAYFRYEQFEKLQLVENEFILMTLHRDYNVDDSIRLERILRQISRIAADLRVVFSIHPRTRKKIAEFGFDEYLSNITTVEPLDYLNLMGLLSKSKTVVTDSGGLQKEAYFAGKTAMLYMHDPAWHELVEHGINFLIDGDNLRDLINSTTSTKLIPGIYGRGDAAQKIVAELKTFLQKNEGRR